MSTVLVTGCDGYLGSRLVARLKKDGHNVIGWGRRTNPTILPCCSYFCGDLLSENAVKRFESSVGGCFDVIYHLADETNRQTMAENPLSCCRNSTLAMRHVLSVFLESAAERLIYVSTGKVYGDTAADKTRFGKYKPRRVFPKYPSGVLGTSRWLAETLLRSSPRVSGKTWRIARVFNVYGPGQADDYLVPTLIRKFANTIDGSISLHGSLDAQRDFVYVDDAVDMLAKTGTLKDSHWADSDFDVGSGEPTSVSKIAKCVGLLTGYGDGKILRADAQQSWRADEPDIEVACLYHTWGSHGSSLEEGLSRVIAYEKEKRTHELSMD